MDGIYSAALEITEAALFEELRKTVEARLARGTKGIVRAALRTAKRIGGRRMLSPWREFDFLSQSAEFPDQIGVCVAIIGLWPVGTQKLRTERDWEIAAAMTTRLLLDRNTANTVHSRVDALMIPSSRRASAAQLVAFMHDHANVPWQEVCQHAAEDENQSLWVDNLEPGFAESKIQEIELTSWRSAAGSLLKWSGLRQADSESSPVYHVPDVDAVNPHKIVVRWETNPRNLPKGTLNYRVAIIKGEDETLAEKVVSHSGTKFEKCAFGPEDFEELREDGGTWDVHITVRPEAHESPANDVAGDPLCPTTEPFVITFLEGPNAEESESSSAKSVRSMVEFVIQLGNKEVLEDAVSASCKLDKKGYIVLKAGRRSGKVFRPALLATLEEMWRQNEYPLGHWAIRVRDDGALLDKPEFIHLPEDSVESTAFTRAAETTKRLAKRAEPKQGFIGFLHAENEADSFVNAWIAAFKAGSPIVACVNTAVVLDQQGNRRGRLVLPWHPLRVAWQQAFDRLALHCRFEQEIPLRRTQDLIRQLDSSYFPLFMPGSEPNESYVFGDVIGFHTTAMLRWDEQEPQAALALMARCLYPKTDEIGGLVGYSAAEAIGREIERFSMLHPECHLAKINALRAGDGLTLTRALGYPPTIKLSVDRQEEESSAQGIKGYVLSMHPSSADHGLRLVGRHLLDISERRRAGVGAVAKDDRWMLSSYSKEGIPLPRLRWKRCTSPMPSEPGHLAVAFDTFESRLVNVSKEELDATHPAEGYGIFAPISRLFSNSPTPQWRTTLCPTSDGLKHPAGRVFTDRLHELHVQMMNKVAVHLENSGGDWPALLTAISGDRADALKRLHEMHEWVLTVDRNAGLEYFDSPRENPEVYDTYVIDCVPEREDLDSVRLVTSTCQLEELKRLLDDSLADMGLSGSSRNCLVLLQALKAISGRLAMRLANSGASRQELIALALLSHLCVTHNDGDKGPWLSFATGFLVPLDDVRDLLLDSGSTSTEQSQVRADLLYVTSAGRTGLSWTFIEVKFRRLLRSARESLVVDRIEEQTRECSATMLDRYFGAHLHEAEKVIRRKRLVRALQFYVDKAHRHNLNDDVYSKITVGLNRLLRPDEYDELPEIARCGYIFCPEFRGEYESLTTKEDDIEVYLFGPDFLAPAGGDNEASAYAVSAGFVSSAENQKEGNVEARIDTIDTRDAEQEGTEPQAVAANKERVKHEERSDGEVTTVHNDPLPIILGENARTGDLVSWTPTIKGNPHLMIVGLPGMGKTECIVNLCVQLARSNIRPIVFAYHDDIEERLNSRLGNTEPVDVYAGLGFNPMHVVGNHPHAWVDHVGMLRDIFACIFPDFGDRQTNEIREALKKSYIESGFNTPDHEQSPLVPPDFRRFYAIIKNSPKPNPGVLERLTELDDYGFFQAAGQAPSLLACAPPAVIRLYTSRNEVLQRATASFVLLHIYQSMFIRGEQRKLTHAVIFDEAHRASGLKLLATMAKECRKYGISLIVSSQAARDFNLGLFSAIANYLTLRMTEADALTLAKNVGASEDARRLAGQLKKLEKYHGLFFREGSRDTLLKLSSPPG